MSFLKSVFVLLSVAYLLITSFLYIRSFSFPSQAKSLHFFIPDAAVERSLQQTSVQGSLPKVILNQLSHNRVLAYSHLFSILVYRSIDPIFLYSLSGMSSMYDNPGPRFMMYPIEFPFFFVALIFILRNLGKIHKKYPFLFWLLGISLVFSGMFTPPLSQLKLFPLVISLRIITAIGILEVFKKFIWQKK